MSFSFRDKPRLSDRIRGKSGDELLNELKEQFDQDKKMFFETAPKWVPGSTSGSGFPRTGFPFDDDMMSRSRQDIRSHLDDLAARHPEFADHLRCPPWGGEVGNSQNRGHKESDCDDDTRSQASGMSSSSSEPHGPDTGAQGPLPNFGLRNTVDLGQKQQEADEDRQGRGQRSMSAPPDNRSQQSEQPQRFVSRVEIPMNAASVAADTSGKPPVVQKQQSTQQTQNTSKQQGNVRHIPIFVEGRDEPILPKNVAPDHVDQVFPPRTQPEVEHIFSPRQPYQPAQSFARPSQFYPQQTFVQQPPPASPKQRQMKSQHNVPTKSEHPVPIKVQHASHSPKTPKPAAHTIPIKVQHTNTSESSPKSQHTTASQQPVKPPCKPPEPVAKDPISRVKMVQKDVEQLRSQVQQYSGTSRKDKEYIYLDEMLTRNLLKLDDIDTEGKENVRQARKEVIKIIQQCISELEAKVPVPEEVPPSETQEPMEEVSFEQANENPVLEKSTPENVESGEMVAPVHNVATAQEVKQDNAEITNSDETTNEVQVHISQAETNESKCTTMEEVDQRKGCQEMLMEDLESKEVPIGETEDKKAPVDQSVHDIPMECVEDKRNVVESVDEVAMRVEGAEDNVAGLENKDDSGTVGEVVEDKALANGARDNNTNTENVEEKAMPMELDEKEGSSSELQTETDSKASGNIPEQQLEQVLLDSSSCDKDLKSG